MEYVIYLSKRILAIVITISAVIAVAYILMHYSPGSFFSIASLESAMGNLQTTDPHLFQTYVKMFESRYGLNEPLWKQVFQYVWHSLTFNFGTSFENPAVLIINQLKTAFPISAGLAIGSVILAIFVGVPLGIVAALKRNTWVDSLLVTLSVAGQAIPSFVLAVMLVLVFGVIFPGVISVNGWGTPSDVVLPVICLAAGNIAQITRYMRSSLIDAMRQEYIRTAESKGIGYWSVVWHHGIRNSLTALITVVGPMFAFTIVNTVWVENVFSIPGLGTLLSSAFVADDIPLAITSVFILSLLVMGMNLLVDIAYRLLDPRVELD